LDAFGKWDRAFESSLSVVPNALGKILRSRERREGKQAHIILTGTSMLLQTHKSTKSSVKLIV